MEDRIQTGWLLSFYGPLLTERQRALLSLYCEEDLSLSEIALREAISRQGAGDAVRKATRRLEALEAQLGLVRRYRRLTEGLRACHEDMRDIPGARAREVEAALGRLLAWEEEEDGV